MSDNTAFEPIEPAEVSLTRPPAEPVVAPPWHHQPRILTALVVSILLALAVIFVLPNMVSPPATEPAAIEARDEASDTAAPVSQPKLESPWQQAQLAKARREAQDILTKLLEKQNFLEKKNVRLWADNAYQGALDSAGEGDRLYRDREFVPAQQQYQQTLEILSKLESEVPDILDAAINNGYAAISEGQADVATDHFELALAIDPKHAQALEGKSRAATLDQVLTLVNKANNALGDHQLIDAQSLFKQALSVDAKHAAAITGSKKVQQLILDRDFNAAMSQGFNALGKGAFASAKSHFSKALALKPKDPAAKTALAQANNQLSQQGVQSLLSRAAASEANEQWHQALVLYQQILSKDATVIDARMGEIRSSARATLDDGIQKILDQPLRLASSNVYRHGQQLLRDARGISAPGEKLSAQIEALQTVLKQAVTPVTVELLSDNRTRVTLFKVGKLGQFQHKQLSLKPGNYVATGSRDGYRDVRVEIQVTHQGLAEPVDVTCREPVS